MIKNEGKSTKKDLEKKKLLKKQAKKRKTIKRVIIAILAVLGIVILISIFTVGKFLTSLDNKDLIEGINPLSKESLNILVLGTDSGDVENIENVNSKKTDTIIVFNYNPTNKKVNLVSIPRDTLIQVDAYDGDGFLRNYWKINSACVLGGDEELINHVENLLEIRVNYMVKINYEAFRNFIDSIGGVKMNIEQDMYYDDDSQDLHINFTGGETVKLDGEKAEEFFRWRGNNDGTGLVDGDLGRIKNQQNFIKAVISKCLRPSIIFKVPKVLDVVQKDIATNMSAKDIINLSFKLISNDGITMSTLSGYEEIIYDESFLIVEKDENRDIIDALKSNKDLELEVSRQEYRLLILNATDINGLAGELKYDMESIGYNEIEVGNLDEEQESIILYNNKEILEQLKSDTGIGKAKKNKDNYYDYYDAVIIIGSNES